MWHVDEGTLNAYLDGALDEYPAAEARRVREHLDACAACRERLEAERRVRDEAASILGLAAPRVDVPTLEELRAYVRAGGPERAASRGRLYRLGWAASVALALGTGWMVRGGPESRAVEAVVPESGDGVEATLPTVEPTRTATAVTEPRAPSVGQSEAAPVERDVVVASAADAPPSPTIDAVDAVDGVQVERREPPESVGPPVGLDLEPVPLVVAALDEPTALLDVPADQPAAPPVPGDVRDTVTPERREAPVALVTSARVAAPAGGLPLGRTAPAPDGRDAVPPDDDSYALAVPGLLVLDVRFRGSGTRPEGQMAFQLLESGDTLQVIHLPPELDPTALEPRNPGAKELVVRRAAGWIVMRAPLDEAALMELMTRLLAGD